jgi:CHAD domain-containing protein
MRQELEPHEDSAPRAAPSRRCAVLLTQSVGRIERWRLPESNWSVLGAGLRRVYRDCRRGMRAAADGGDGKDFHAWRREVKCLWHQLELLAPLRSSGVGRLAARCHRLGDLLGDEHDLAMLQSQLTSSAAKLQHPDAADRLEKLFDERRAGLQRKALALGARTFVQRPSAFAEQLHGDWRKWRAKASVRPRQASVSSGRPASTT